VNVAPLGRNSRLAAFKRGFLVLGRPAPLKAKGGKRGDVNEFSTRSRIRCAWAYLNAETEWLAMVTLTYPVDPDVEEIRDHLRAWLARIKRSFSGQLDFGWVVEATKGGRPHFHVFFGDGGQAGRTIEKEKTEKIIRKGKTYRICRGRFESVVVKAWLEIVRGHIKLTKDESKAFESFQRGGIVEKLNSTDAAARYVSKEASKRTQKGEGINLGKGCFWRLARHLKGRARFISEITRKGRENLPSFSRIFDRDAVMKMVDFERFESADYMSEDQVKELVKTRQKERMLNYRGHNETRWSRFDLEEYDLQ
jgi:hypothetical protein